LAVDLVEPLGSETLIHGHLSGGPPVVVKVPGAVQAQDAVTVSVQHQHVHLFDAATGKRLEPLSQTAAA
ncbi:MAG: TOBE domain-containing protein, partial [Proteobacteria bacterium]|nr:TOBE domain-containing protein [Pseudomonadota bacterium]